MALTLSISAGYGSTNVAAGMQVTYVASVTNSGATAVTLNGLWVSRDSMSGNAGVGQPTWQTPGVSVGAGYPTLAAGSTYNYPFSVVFSAPNMAGGSPNSAPGGAAPPHNAAYPIDSGFSFTINSLSSDSTTASATYFVPVLSTVAPFPIPQGGALQMNSGFNLVNFLTSFA